MSWKDRLRKYAPYVGYPIFYLACLVVFASWTFPYEKLRDRIVTSFNAEQRRGTGSQELQIKEVGPSWLTGVKMTDVRLVSPPTEPEGKPGEVKLEEVRARISLLGLLVGARTVNFHVKGLGGEVAGEVSTSSRERDVDVEIEGLDIGQVGPLAQAIGLPLEGRLSGTVKLTMPENKAAKGNGSVNLEVKDTAVGDGKAKLRGALALPKIQIGTLTVVGEAKDGLIKFSKIASGGRDVELAGDGRIQMREMAAESTADMNLRFKINDAYRTKSDITKSLFGAPGSTAPALFDLDPKVKRSKRDDGYYGWHLKGTLARPDFEPVGGARGAPL